MTALANSFDLGWHIEWLPAHARDRAAQAFTEMLGTIDMQTREANGLLLWERIELTLAGEVYMGTAGIEEPEFVTRAQVAALSIFRHRLHELVRCSPMAGRA